MREPGSAAHSRSSGRLDSEIFAPDHFFVDLEARFRFLSASAATGRVVDGQGQRPGALRRTRVSLRFRNYLIFYRPYRRHIRVVRILHAARDIAGILRLPR